MDNNIETETKAVEPKDFGIAFTTTSYGISENDMVALIERALDHYNIPYGPIGSSRRGVRGRRKKD